MDDIVAGGTDDESLSSHVPHGLSPWFSTQILESSDYIDFAGFFRVLSAVLTIIVCDSPPEFFPAIRVILMDCIHKLHMLALIQCYDPRLLNTCFSFVWYRP